MFTMAVSIFRLYCSIYYRRSTCERCEQRCSRWLSRIESIETIDYKKLVETKRCDDQLQSALK